MFDRYAFFFQGDQSGFADKITRFVFQINRPAHTGFQRAGIVVHIVAVQIHTGFHAQGVARAEAAGLHTGFAQGDKESVRFAAGQHHFYAVFSGVAGAGDKPVTPQIGTLEHRQIINGFHPFGFNGQQFFNCFRALYRQHGKFITGG